MINKPFGTREMAQWHVNLGIVIHACNTNAPNSETGGEAEESLETHRSVGLVYTVNSRDPVSKRWTMRPTFEGFL